MKGIETLIQDIEHVLRTGEGWTDEISRWVANDIEQSLNRQFNRTGKPKGNLRLSSLGTPCERKLWYSTTSGVEGQPVSSSTYNKFIFGDLTESYILGLAKAAGHRVLGLQDSVDVFGIRGSRDCVIDGMLIDVKSASSASYRKFAKGQLRENDPFGYISQLSSYLYGSQSDPIVTYKTKAGFLAFDKQDGRIVLDVYDLSEELKNKQSEVERKKAIVKRDTPPERPYQEEVSGKSGNKKLAKPCEFCDFKQVCWPTLRMFQNKDGYVQYLTEVKREPTGSYMEI